MIIIQINETREVLLPLLFLSGISLLCSVLLVPDFFKYNQTESNSIQDQEILRVLIKMTVMILSSIYFFYNPDWYLSVEIVFIFRQRKYKWFFCFPCSGVRRCFAIARKILNSARNLENTVLLWVEMMFLFYRFTHFPLHLYFTSSCTEEYFLAFKKAVIKV